MSVVDSVEILKGRVLTEDEYFKAALLGWCLELVRIPPPDRTWRSNWNSYKPFSSSRTT